MKKTRKGLCGLLAIALCVSAMTGCAANPDRGSVTSKNDGVFEQNMTVAATAPLDEQLQYTDTFTSHDGTVEYNINLQQQITSDPLPIVEVVPHFFTGEEVKNICNILLGETEWRDQVSLDNPLYCKNEIQHKINWMTNLTNVSAMRKVMGDIGGPDYDYEEEINIMKTELQLYTVMLETAPEDNPRKVCDWTFRNSSSDPNNRTIHATSYVGNLEYNVYAVQRDARDYKLSSISVSLGNNRDYLSSAYQYANLCYTEKPTQEELDTLAGKAQSMLDQMGVGGWQISSVELIEDDFFDNTQYNVKITAAPVLNGAAAIYGQPFGNLTGEDGYAANYQMTFASFLFSKNGELLYFEMITPLDIQTVVNEGAATFSMEELLNTAKEHLALTGIEETADYFILSLYYDKTVSCRIEVDHIEFGLARVNVANQDFTYYYIPALAVYGKTRFFDKGTDNPVDSVFVDPEPKSTDLVWINAVDGSIIGAT